MPVPIKRLLGIVYEKAFNTVRDIARFRLGHQTPLRHPQRTLSCSANPYDDDVRLLTVENNHSNDSFCVDAGIQSEIQSENNEDELQRSPSHEGTSIQEADWTEEEDARIFVKQDERGKPCFAMFITEEMAYAQIDLAKADQMRSTKEETLKRVQRRLEDLKARIGTDDKRNTSSKGSQQTEESEETTKTSADVERLEKKVELLHDHINALEHTIKHYRIVIQRTLQDAMKAAALQQVPEYEESVSDGGASDSPAQPNEQDLQEDDVPADDLPQEPEISDEEKAIREARDNYWAAGVAYEGVLREFNRKEYYSAMQLRGFEEALKNGAAGCSQSVFDRKILKQGMWLTSNLIDKENDLDQRRKEAEELGAFDDGWGQESYYGDSQVTMLSYRDGEHPEGGYRSVLKPAMIGFIESWLDNRDDLDSPEVVEDVKVDEWDAEPVGFSDSLSVVDLTSNAKNIGRWENIRDKARQDRPAQLEDSEDVGEFEAAPQLRPRACSV